MKRVIFTGPVVRVLTAFAGVAGVGLIVYFLSGMPAPREVDRISSANGEISVIRPRDWVGKSMYAAAGAQYSVLIVCEPPKTVGIGPRLVVGTLRERPNIDQLKVAGFLSGKFQDQDALLLSEMVKRDFFWRAVFEREGTWYEVLLRLDAPQDVPNSDWWPYLTSFRAGRATTQPSSP